MYVAVIGSGRLGSPMAAVFAAAGHMIYCVDSNPDYVTSIRNGIAPVSEPGLQEMFTKYRKQLFPSDDIEEATMKSSMVFIVVPTLSQADGSFSVDCILETLEPIAKAIQRGAHPTVVITSTVSPRTMDDVIVPQLERLSGTCVGAGFQVAYSPEFIALGSVIKNLMNPDFILIGANVPDHQYIVHKFYYELHRTFGTKIIRFADMNLINAEITKLAVNCALVMKISYANSLGDLCEMIPGADARIVCDAIGNDTRIGPACLKPSTSCGGPCLPRDSRALISAGVKAGVSMPLASASDFVNNTQNRKLFTQVMHSSPKTVAVLGLTYKPNTNVTTASAGTYLLSALANHLVEVNVHDPQATEVNPYAHRFDSARDAVRDADVVVIATPWDEYTNLKPEFIKPGARIIDCWSILPDKPQFTNVTVPGRNTKQ